MDRGSKVNSVIFRVDSGNIIGIGHLMRTLTLAEEFKKKCSKIIFICNKHKGNLNQLVLDRGFELIELEVDDTISNNHNTWLTRKNLEDSIICREKLSHIDIENRLYIVDHYSIGQEWSSSLRFKNNRIVFIDDMADRSLDCDLLINQTLNFDEGKYRNLTNCKKLIGSKYTILRKEFLECKENAIKIRKKNSLDNVLIMMGGSDQFNITGHILQNLKEYFEKNFKSITVVIGFASEHYKAVEDLKNKYSIPVKLIRQSNRISELMLESDIVFGAAGGSCWERAVLGLPSYIISFSDNQTQIAENLESSGAIKYLGDFRKIKKLELQEILESNEITKDNYQEIVKKNYSICDGLGCRRIIKEIDSLFKES